MPDETRRRIADAIAAYESTRLNAGDRDLVAHAAVTLVMRPLGGYPPPDDGLAAELLFIQRAEFDGDPWSGHMALPGGRRDPDDRDLRETAIRELREETSLVLPRESILGRLDELVPQNPTLPAIGVTPYVAWYEGPDTFRPNEEVNDHVWIPLAALLEPEYRSTFRLEHRGLTRKFPTIEYDGYTIWGLTYKIIHGFLAVLAPTEAQRLEEQREESGRLQELVDRIKQERDELKLKVHLGSAELRDDWDELEQKWEGLRSRLGQVADVADDAGEDIKAAARLLADELKEGYRKVKDRL